MLTQRFLDVWSAMELFIEGISYMGEPKIEQGVLYTGAVGALSIRNQ